MITKIGFQQDYLHMIKNSGSTNLILKTYFLCFVIKADFINRIFSKTFQKTQAADRY